MDVAGLVGGEQQIDELCRGGARGRVPVDGAVLGVQRGGVLAPHLAPVGAREDAAHVALQPALEVEHARLGL